MDRFSGSSGLRAWEYIKKQNSASEEALNRVAIENGIVTYTYKEMFRQWERYAAAFSALNMTESSHARVGLLGSTSAEGIFAFYGLNMVGAEISVIAIQHAFSIEKVCTTIRNEKLTDIILTDDYAQANLITYLLNNKKSLGLRNVLVLHIPVGGSTVNELITLGQAYKHVLDRVLIAPICMDALLDLYGETEIEYALSDRSESAVILHTSGTTSGTGKPIPLTDVALNGIGDVYAILVQKYPDIKDNIVTGVTIDLSNSYSLVNQVHGPLSLGGTVAMIPGCAMNPEFYKSIPEFGQTILFVTAAFIEIWMRSADRSKLDFSSLKLLVLGGSFVSAADKHRYYEFFREHGAENLRIINGYGLTELGGACILSTEDLDDEAIGYPMPGVEICLYDEEKKRYHTLKDAPCSGILYVRSGLMTSGRLGDREVVSTELIDGKPYVCTNDVVRVDETGKIFFLGRANRYFTNEKGIKYESGKVEVEVSRQPGIEGCAVVPLYVKLMHDNVPMLCVKLHDNDDRAAETVKKALLNIFRTEKTLALDQMPHRVLITDKLPRNQNGKVDIYKIMRGEAEGVRYSVRAVRIGSRLVDIVMEELNDDKEKEEILQNAYKTMAKDIMESNKAINNIKSNNKTEEKTMTQYNPFEFFKSMNEKSTEAFKKMFENNPYAQSYKDRYEKQVENYKKFFEDNPFFQARKEYYEKQTENFKKAREEFKPNFDRMNEYTSVVKEYVQAGAKKTTEAAKDFYEENKKFRTEIFEMAKEDAKRSPVKKAVDKVKEDVKAARKATEKEETKKEETKKPAAKKPAAKKTAAKTAPAKKTVKKTPEKK